MHDESRCLSKSEHITWLGKYKIDKKQNFKKYNFLGVFQEW